MSYSKSLFVFFCIIFASVAQQNLITNGGFESDGGGWNLYVNSDNGAKASISYLTTGAQEGNKFARVTVSSVANDITANNWNVQLQNPSWTAKKGINYRIVLWARSNTSQTVQIAVAGDVSSPYTYRGGTEISVGPEWKKFEFFRLSDVDGFGRLNFNFYCGYATGTYDFDNVTLSEYTSTFPLTMVLPTQGAWESGVYRNLFAEMGHSQIDIDAKVNDAYQQLFFGDREQEAVFTKVGSDMGFINKPNSGEIITEGQSYGMIISLMMSDKDVFDRLWRFAKKYMQHHSGGRKGYFSWQISEIASNYTMKDPNPAPDGEEYFVTALLLAAKKWGNGTGVLNYQEQADSILFEMLHKEDNSEMIRMIDTTHAMIVFAPTTMWNPTITDASYHLPGFYKIWATLASRDNNFWARMADSSRAFFKRACHPTTGLASDLQYFNGTPYNKEPFTRSQYYKSDAWRVAANIGFDYAWLKADPWEVEQSVRLLKFFEKEGDYKQTYKIDGTRVAEPDGGFYSSSAGQRACNAVAALASNDPVGWKFVDAFWKSITPSGRWRYYDGLLHMLGLLHVSGKFKVDVTSANSIHNLPESNVLVNNSNFNGAVEVINLSGKVIAIFDSEKGSSLKEVGNRELNFRSLKTGMYYIKGRDRRNNVIVKRISVVK